MHGGVSAKIKGRRERRGAEALRREEEIGGGGGGGGGDKARQKAYKREVRFVDLGLSPPSLEFLRASRSNYIMGYKSDYYVTQSQIKDV